jgi:anti-sigma factor RsiW
MRDTACTLERRDEVLVAYLYDDLGPDERHSFAAHLSRCPACRTELDELRGVRSGLAEWTPPAPARVLTLAPPMAAPRGRWAAMADLPAWAQVAAAMLVLGVATGLAAGIGNIDIRVDGTGVTLRGGWSAAPDSPAEADALPLQAGAAGARDQTDAPWRAELAALETSLRAEVQNSNARRASADEAGGNAALVRQVRGFIAASETNQLRELALRVAELRRDFQVQRTADLERIQRNLIVLENTTGGAISQQRALLDRIAMRVSQQQ